MPFVLDASVTAAWSVEDEFSPYSEMVESRLLRESAVVPPLWWYEVRNFMVVCERRNHLRSDQSAKFLALLASYPIDTDSLQEEQTTLALASTHGLTFYDAVYLQLAIRRRLPLATLDRALEAAARAEGVEIVS